MATPDPLPTFLYKIYTTDQGPQPAASELDHSSGFIHLSTAAQVLHVANRFFPNETNLVIMKIPLASMQYGLKWESNDGDVFPHLYAEDLDHALPEDFDYVTWERDRGHGPWESTVNVTLEY
jgi:uncharacterized protein (DUF952 family)